MSIYCARDGTRHPRFARYCMRCGAEIHLVDPTGSSAGARFPAWPKPAIEGERHPRARLTSVMVRAIRLRYASGEVTQKELAEQYGVSAGTISQVVTRRIWDHVA